MEGFKGVFADYFRKEKWVNALISIFGFPFNSTKGKTEKIGRYPSRSMLSS